MKKLINKDNIGTLVLIAMWVIALIVGKYDTTYWMAAIGWLSVGACTATLVLSVCDQIEKIRKEETK